MARYKVSWLDVVSHVVDGSGVEVATLARAIESLSAAFRSAQPDPGYRRRPVRLAYLCHILPAHICDLRRVFEVALEDLLGTCEHLSVLALGSGPGAEALALLDAITSRNEKNRSSLQRLSVQRVDRVHYWDREQQTMLAAALEALAGRDASLGQRWKVDAEEPALQADLCKPPSDELLVHAGTANVITLCNVVSEIPPRAVATLPDGFLSAVAEVASAAPDGARLVIVDRAGSPACGQRVKRLIEAVGARRPGLEVRGPTRVTHRCGCSFPRTLVPVYKRVHLPTTNQEDRPVRNCDTLWACLDLGSAQRPEPTS